MIESQRWKSVGRWKTFTPDIYEAPPAGCFREQVKNGFRAIIL